MSLKPASSAAPSPVPAAGPSPPSSVPLDVWRIGAFLLIATAVTAALSLPFAAGMLPVGAVGLFVPLAQLSPLVGVLLVRRPEGRWWRALALQIPSWRALALAAAAGAIVVAAVPMVRTLLGLALGAHLATDVPLLGLSLALPAVLVMQTVFAIGEEGGWRGWLHQQLAPRGSGRCRGSSVSCGRCGTCRSCSPPRPGPGLGLGRPVLGLMGDRGLGGAAGRRDSLPP